MKLDTVSFRRHDDADVCEIQLQAGNVGVFPANEVIAGSVPPMTYAELYHEAFDAYKRGELKPALSDADRIAELEARVASLTAENAELRRGASQRTRKAAQIARPRNVPAKEKAAAKAKAKAKAKKPAKKAGKAKK